jgi:M6 family metalloprotease-like protein
MKLFQFVAALLAAAVAVNAAPANPEPQTYYQPDGAETPLVYLKGNQLYNWLVDEKGYTVVRDEQGWYNYGMKTEDGDIVSSGVKLGSKNPKKVGIAPGLMHDEHKRPANFLGDNSAESVREHRSLLHVPENALCGFAGSKDDPCRLRSLVFLVKFSDHSDRILPAKEDYDLLFNNNGADDGIAPTGSVRDVFFENSYGTFILESYVTPWLAVTRTEVQTVDDNLGLNRPGTKATWKEAIGMFDDMNLQDLNSFDEDEDGFFDCVVILHSGSPAEVGGIDCENNKDKSGRIWSHATQFPLYETAGGITTVKRFYVASAVFGSCPDAGPFTEWNIARIAVIAHECAHFLGLPDLYDTDGGQGIGTFDLMGKSLKTREMLQLV